MTERSGSIIPWTHVPDHSAPLGEIQWNDDGTFERDMPGGWRVTMTHEEGARCDARHPEVENIGGSCGAHPGHEHPHVWSLDTVRVIGMARRAKVDV